MFWRKEAPRKPLMSAAERKQKMEDERVAKLLREKAEAMAELDEYSKSRLVNTRDWNTPAPPMAEERKRELVSKVMQDTRRRNFHWKTNGRRRPRVRGLMSGSQWNCYIEDVWTHPENAVFHIVRLPEDRGLRQISFAGAKTKNSRVTTLELGDVPEQVLTPDDQFEVYVEENCVPYVCDMPNHFVVKKPQGGLKFDPNPPTYQEEMEAAKNVPDTIWTLEAKRLHPLWVKKQEELERLDERELERIQGKK
ncbi:hypothetical protein GNI_176330 [Gregarina niphandrodes]|uniref:Uncharacterized protein n=1 Tax=Gregarina niphandrodes TaxID=110365 RepID=A0A023AXA2_GRENI|nr:hypothetical protein GNI_176330 [Gregarina niphandrodes]EZG43339.1 hypothetical protein GNI_176330 [Gregarina niphandrodes]|eukprot:XP_011133410.1 hypothetical protein GNI_176330 [Gregarina niphandrodes]